MEVRVSAFEPENMNQLELEWFLKFRKHKKIDTLSRVLEQVEARYSGQMLILNAINVAYCARENEMRNESRLGSWALELSN